MVCKNLMFIGEKVQERRGNKKYMNEFILMWKNIFDYKGRARRQEYWMPYLWFMVIGVVEVIVLCADLVVVEVVNELIGMILFVAILLVFLVVNIALNVALLSLTVRRYHDAGFSGWWLLATCVLSFCWIGSIIHLIILCLDSKEDNQWGPNPKKNIQSFNGYQQ